jgi:thioredoxin reductase
MPVIEAPLARLVTVKGKLGGVEFKVGPPLECDALFFDTPSYQQCNIAQLAGCAFTDIGGIRCNRLLESTVPGVFVAGNITRDVQLAIVAAAEGAKAAFAINRALTREAFGPP